MLYWILKHVLVGPWLRVLFRPWVEGLENVPQQGPAAGTAPVHHDHAALARLPHAGLHQRVVLVALDGHRPSREALAGAVIAQRELDGPRLRRLVGEVWCGEVAHGVAPRVVDRRT